MLLTSNKCLLERNIFNHAQKNLSPNRENENQSMRLDNDTIQAQLNPNVTRKDCKRLRRP